MKYRKYFQKIKYFKTDEKSKIELNISDVVSIDRLFHNSILLVGAINLRTVLNGIYGDVLIGIKPKN